MACFEAVWSLMVWKWDGGGEVVMNCQATEGRDSKGIIDG